MDWLIWVIVIVVVVAVVWWLMSRNTGKNQVPASSGEARAGTPGRPGATSPAATEPANTRSVPETAAAAAGVAGLAGVTNLGKAASEGSGPVDEEPTGVHPPADSPAIQEPVLDKPEVAEPALDEPVVDTAAVDSPAADPAAPAGAATGGDVDDWEDSPADASANTSADRAEWESSWTDAQGTPVHHHEYTDPHAPTLPGAETAAAEEEGTVAPDTAAASGHLAADHPYGVGSAAPAQDGSGPEGYPVKAEAASMTYYDEDSTGYAEAGADVWFESPAHAEAAGFRPPRRTRY